MEVLILSADQLKCWKSKLNQHLQLVFNSHIEAVFNEELLCVVLVIDDELIVAFGFAYRREMSQRGKVFNAGIIGGIAVHPDYRKQGLCKIILENIERSIELAGVEQSFLFAYEPSIYVTSGYTILDTPIRYFDRSQKRWNTYVYRGGMVKKHPEPVY
ncbi:GNAT family N-acetyltransferase [Vibrio astriarenae]|uniref:GNAT family N-acetyltransferase n=1 Tax=Vibrio astriarenae TaxID=1481923 RepID=A0A7Z2T2J8_9VIBR|nr:GNAT family N-acetyltransferase [Vibrio astriarenae]QIA63117.1 GNAT family N-acetyltransferase [Vibrio astriarenae]